MKRLIVAAALCLLLCPVAARAQGPTETPTPTPTNTPTATITFTPSPTLDIWELATIGPENQLVALEYSITAGDGFIAVVLLMGIGLLSFIVFITLREARE